MFLSLLFKAVKADHRPQRVAAMTKRLLQVAAAAPANFAAGALLITSELIKVTGWPGLVAWWLGLLARHAHHTSTLLYAAVPPPPRRTRCCPTASAMCSRARRMTWSDSETQRTARMNRTEGLQVLLQKTVKPWRQPRPTSMTCTSGALKMQGNSVCVCDTQQATCGVNCGVGHTV